MTNEKEGPVKAQTEIYDKILKIVSQIPIKTFDHADDHADHLSASHQIERLFESDLSTVKEERDRLIDSNKILKRQWDVDQLDLMQLTEERDRLLEVNNILTGRADPKTLDMLNNHDKINEQQVEIDKLKEERNEILSKYEANVELLSGANNEILRLKDQVAAAKMLVNKWENISFERSKEILQLKEEIKTLNDPF